MDSQRRLGWWRALGDRLRRAQMVRRVRQWERAGRPGLPPHAVKQAVLRHLAAEYELHVLVETGTFMGDMVAAQRDVFDRIYSIELSPRYHERAQRRFRRTPHVELICGDSGREIGSLVARLDAPALFWLDGHYSGGTTAKGEHETPIIEELEAILTADERRHVIVIDDARCFGADPAYPTIAVVRALIRDRRPDLTVEVQDDTIRIFPGR